MLKAENPYYEFKLLTKALKILNNRNYLTFFILNYMSICMDITKELAAFKALSQETRLKSIKLLVEYGKGGMPAGVLSDRLAIPHNTLSFHLTHLSEAGLVSSKKQGRQVIYFANLKAINNLMGFLAENCCVAEGGTCDDIDKLKKGIKC